ncbi:MAG: SIMPL domain-containing protein [Nitrospira sp.]|nr:SIMPL domain-containing protein [Nitrospira sp.]
MRLRMFLFALMIVPVAAQAGGGTAPDVPTLTVNGTGIVTVQPDTAFVTLGMETAAKSLSEAQRLNGAVMQKVMDRLQQLKIDKDRIQTSSFNVTPQYRPPSKHPVDAPAPAPEIVGYTVSNRVTVEIRDLQKVAAVIEETSAAGANLFQGLHWGLRDEQPARLQALKVAAGKAREKAATLSDALNLKLVRFMHVTEGIQFIRPAPYAGRAMMAADSGGGDIPLASGEMKVEATVTLSYEISKD